MQRIFRIKYVCIQVSSYLSIVSLIIRMPNQLKKMKHKFSSKAKIPDYIISRGKLYNENGYC